MQGIRKEEKDRVKDSEDEESEDAEGKMKTR